MPPGRPAQGHAARRPAAVAAVLALALAASACMIEGERQCSGSELQECVCGMLGCDWETVTDCGSGLLCVGDQLHRRACLDGPPRCGTTLDTDCGSALSCSADGSEVLQAGCLAAPAPAHCGVRTFDECQTAAHCTDPMTAATESCSSAPSPHCEVNVVASCTGERCQGNDLVRNECTGGACHDRTLASCKAPGVKACISPSVLRTYAGCGPGAGGGLGCLYSSDEDCSTHSQCTGDQVFTGTCSVDRCENTVAGELCDDRCTSAKDWELRSCVADPDARCQVDSSGYCDDLCSDVRHVQFRRCQLVSGSPTCVVDAARGAAGSQRCDDRCATSKRIHEGFCDDASAPDASCSDRFTDPAYSPDAAYSRDGYCIDECFDAQANVAGWSPDPDGHEVAASFDRRIHKHYCTLKSDGIATCSSDVRDTDCFEQNFGAHLFHAPPGASPSGWSFSWQGNDGRVLANEGFQFMRCQTDAEEVRDKQCTYSGVVHKCDDWCSADGTEGARVRDGSVQPHWLQYRYRPLAPPVPAAIDAVREALCRPTDVACSWFDYCLASDRLQTFACTTSAGSLPEDSKCRRDDVESRQALDQWDAATERVPSVDYCIGGRWRQCTAPGNRRGASPCCSGEVDEVINITEMQDETGSLDSCRGSGDAVGGRACRDVRADVGIVVERTRTLADGRAGLNTTAAVVNVTVKSLAGHAKNVQAIASDAGAIVTGSEDATAMVWEHGGGFANVANLSGHALTVTAVALVPAAVLTSSLDGTVRLWARPGFAGAGTLDAGVALTSVAADGATVVAGCQNGSAMVWDGLAPRGVLNGHAGPVSSVAIDADYIHTGGDDDAAVVWDRPSLGKVATLVDHTNNVSSVFADADFLYTASFDGSVLVHQRSPPFTIVARLDVDEEHHSFAALSVYATLDRVYVAVSNGTIVGWERGGGWRAVSIIDAIFGVRTISADDSYVYATAGDRTGKVLLKDPSVRTNATFGVNVTKGATVLEARLALSGYASPYPRDVSLDVGSDGSPDWSRPGVLAGGVTTTDLSLPFQAALDLCTAPEGANCTIDVTLAFRDGGAVAVTDVDVRARYNREPPGLVLHGPLAGRLDTDVVAAGNARDSVCGPFPEYDEDTECCMTASERSQCSDAVLEFDNAAIEQEAPARWCDGSCGNVGSVFRDMHAAFKATFECLTDGFCTDLRRGMCCADTECHSCGLDEGEASCEGLFDSRSCGGGWCSRKCSTCFVNASDLFAGTVRIERNNLTSPFIVERMRRLADNARCDRSSHFCRHRSLGGETCPFPLGQLQLDGMGYARLCEGCLSGVCSGAGCDNESMRGGWYLPGLDAVPAAEPAVPDLCGGIQGSGIVDGVRRIWCGEQARVGTLLDVHFVANHTNIPCLSCPDLQPPPSPTLPPSYYGGSGVEGTVVTQGERPMPSPAPEGPGSIDLAGASGAAAAAALAGLFLVALHRMRV